jgi:hypothetical protein
MLRGRRIYRYGRARGWRNPQREAGLGVQGVLVSRPVNGSDALVVFLSNVF